MGRNDINLDQINARLGDMNKPRQYDSYDEDGNIQDMDDGDDDGGSTFNAGFIASVLALFVAVSGGTYMFSAGINPLKYANFSGQWAGSRSATLSASSADGQCLKGWKTGFMNGNQMHCYLTTRVNRLCNPQEKETLVARILVFDDDYSTFQGNLLLETAKMSIGTPISDRMQLGIEAAKADNANSDAESSKHMQNAADIASGMMEGVNGVLEGQEYQNHGIGDLRGSGGLMNELRDLGKNGYLSLSDFPSYPPKWVRQALTDVKVIGLACK
jgi:hypothetical protein